MQRLRNFFSDDSSLPGKDFQDIFDRYDNVKEQVCFLYTNVRPYMLLGMAQVYPTFFNGTQVETIIEKLDKNIKDHELYREMYANAFEKLKDLRNSVQGCVDFYGTKETILEKLSKLAGVKDKLAEGKLSNLVGTAGQRISIRFSLCPNLCDFRFV